MSTPRRKCDPSPGERRGAWASWLASAAGVAAAAAVTASLFMVPGDAGRAPPSDGGGREVHAAGRESPVTSGPAGRAGMTPLCDQLLATADPALEPQPLQVTTARGRFDARVLQVRAGQPVSLELMNADLDPHNVSVFYRLGGCALFQGETVPAGASTTYRFIAPPAGHFDFICELHPWMRGTLAVT